MLTSRDTVELTPSVRKLLLNRALRRTLLLKAGLLILVAAAALVLAYLTS